MFSKNASDNTSYSTWFLTFNWGHCTVLRFVRLSQSAKLDVGDTQLSGLVIDLIWFCVDMHLIRISFCLLEECFYQCCLLHWTLLYLICFLLILSLIVISPKLSSFSALSCVFQRPAWPDSTRSDQVHFMQQLLCTLHSFVDKQVPKLIYK